MPSPFVKYRDFFEPEIAAEFMLLLKSNGIEYDVEEISDHLGPVYGDRPLQKATTVKVKQADFARVDALLEADAAKELESVDKDHYLFDFTNDELYDILSKPDEWNPLDYQLARKILRDRGIVLQEEVVKLMKDQRLQQLAQPEPSHSGWIYAGYIFALMGGFLGAFIGWHMMATKKVLPNGQRVASYSDHDRRHGQRIFIIGVVMSIVWVTAKLVGDSRFGPGWYY